MKTKLTLTIDSQLIPRAKRYARARGVSLSSVVEEALRTLASDESPSFVERWRGQFEAAAKDEGSSPGPMAQKGTETPELNEAIALVASREQGYRQQGQ